MLTGSIVAVLSATTERARELARSLGKEKEPGVFYKKDGEVLMSALAAGVDDLQSAALFASMAGFVILEYSSGSREHAEAALLAEASGAEGSVVTDEEESFRETFKGFKVAGYYAGLKPVQAPISDIGVVPIDQAFVVRGVGTVVLGFSLTEVRVHDRLLLLPSMKPAEVKSIQVLDVDYQEVGPGVRVGIALKGVEEKDAKASYALAKDWVKLGKSIKVEASFPWAPRAQQLHAFASGIKAFGQFDGSALKVERPLPTGARAILVNLNLQQGRLRVYGSGRVEG